MPENTLHQFPPGVEVFRVGGCVRDELLGVASQDTDFVVVGAVPEDLTRLGFKSVGQQFPVFLCPKTADEFALARKEKKTGPGHGGFVCDFSPDVTLEEDLSRRDLTINAMAMTPAGAVVDPYGGRRDLEERVLRHVSDAFREDPLRVLRVARFMARYAPMGFSVAGETLDLMRDIADSGELATLTAERVWGETAKALEAPAPSAYFQTLRECGALAVIFPELDALFGVPQPPEHHPEIDTGVHVCLVLDQAARLSPRADVRFAAAMHDLGKGVTPVDILPKHLDHETAGVPLVEAVCDRLKVPGEVRALAVLVCGQHLKAHRALELRPGKVMTLIEAAGGLRRRDRFEQFLVACEADARGRTGLEGRPYPQADHLRRCFDAAEALDTKPIVARYAGDGKRIGDRIRAARLQEIERVIGAQRALSRHNSASMC